MFVSIQTKKRKRPDQNGAAKRVEVIIFHEQGYYSYMRSDDRFESDNLDVYQFRLNHSYRGGGKVKKEQWNICSLSYYDIANYDETHEYKVETSINTIAAKANVEAATIWQLFLNKFQPLQTKIVEAFEASDEYKTNKRNQELIHAYEQQKKAFDNLYGHGEYNRCYDFYGNLHNAKYLEHLKMKVEQKKREEEAKHKRAYEEQSRRSHVYHAASSTYNESERVMLKEMYRMASKKFHPYAGGTEEKMKFLTKLKEQWGL